MDSVVPLRFISYKAVSPLVSSIIPNASVLIQYPMFFTMARVTTHRELCYSLASGKKLSAIHASLLHGISVYNRYGVFALYRGLPVYLGHSFLNTLLVHPTKSLRSKKLASVARVAADAAAYPLLLACTRMAAYTTEDSQWSFSECLINTIQLDGWIGLWSGALPFLLVSAYKELEDVLFTKVKTMYPKLDEADTAIVGFLRIGLGAVITSPFLTMSTILRCQSNNQSLLKPTSFFQVFSDMPWKWNILALSLVTALGAVNLALIHDKHKEEPESSTENERNIK